MAFQGEMVSCVCPFDVRVNRAEHSSMASCSITLPSPGGDGSGCSPGSDQMVGPTPQVQSTNHRSTPPDPRPPTDPDVLCKALTMAFRNRDFPRLGINHIQ